MNIKRTLLKNVRNSLKNSSSKSLCELQVRALASLWDTDKFEDLALSFCSPRLYLNVGTMETPPSDTEVLNIVQCMVDTVKFLRMFGNNGGVEDVSRLFNSHGS